MTDAPSTRQPHPLMWLIWFALFVGLPALVASWEARSPVAREAGARLVRHSLLKPPSTPPPAVEPVELYALDRDEARALNASIRFSPLPNPAARPFVFAGTPLDLARATDCLAAAQLYEAGDDATGERAVAQVVLNRVRHPAFPKSVCGVVFQGQERSTGCQFTFTCDGALARVPPQAAWERARDIAKAALAGKVFKPVGYATHYHTDWVVPYWSGSLEKISAVDTHLFFRWRGWWGTPPAFRKAAVGGEPVIPSIARLSAAHQDGPLPAGLALAGGSAAALAARPQQAIGADSLGQVMAGVRLVAIAPGARSFLVELGRGTSADSWPAVAQTFCAGRPECRIMAWRAGTAPPGFPLSGDQIESMSFAYIHNVSTGLQRSLWNCAQTPRANAGECMRQRVPTAAPPVAGAEVKAVVPQPALDGVRRKERFETVRIAPPVPAPAVVAPPKP
ncbi:cell wall hydrolase [Sphingobium mellinum]|uniref:cell wall hydrolase n=1 Tax=Sphingobium mellinum TaxID=1387166 RepID=UPI0030ECCE08